MFGICYGNQSMAHALGGTVERAREPEIGWFDIVTDDPLRSPRAVVAVALRRRHRAAGREGAGPQPGRPAGMAHRAQLRHPVPPGGDRDDARPLDGGVDDELAAVGTTPAELMAATRANVIDSRPPPRTSSTGSSPSSPAEPTRYVRHSVARRGNRGRHAGAPAEA